VKAAWALLAAALIAAVGLGAGQSAALRVFFGVIVPYAAIAIFLVGISARVIQWARTPVPFRIPTTCGQQKSLPWLKHARLESPVSVPGVVGRMALEILLFRSLFRNTKIELRAGPQLIHGESKFLWLGAIAFHYSFLVIFLRHLRFFMEPIPGFVTALQTIDGFFQVGAPVLYITDVTFLAALGYLLLRRLKDPVVRYISLFTDYFALFLLLGLGVSGVLLRYFTRIELLPVKQLAMGLVTLSPVVPAGIGSLFFVHLLFLSTLIAYFPFSKLVHMGGVFLSPTRNLANNNRAKRHVNPRNHPVKIHTYEEWESEFHDKIVAAGLPLDEVKHG
jgi:nitrate reductase gamma subunit